MLPPVIAPKLPSDAGPVSPAICRVSPDLKRLAFYAPAANPPGLFVGEVEQGDRVGESADWIWSSEAEHAADLAWSADGQYVAFTLTGGPPPGDVRIGVLHLQSLSFTPFPGMSFAWAGSGATIIIADPASSRLYLRDVELNVEHGVADLADDGDPHFSPVISVSPDGRRFAWVTRRVADNLTHVHLARHDGRQWSADPLTHLPGASVRILPFWSHDSAALALYVVDLQRHHTAIIAVPDREDAQGQILYTSDSVDAFITPATHPDGRLIAIIRSHPGQGGQEEVEHRLVLVDPVEQAVAPITTDATITGHLRWLDGQTLLVEGAPAVWTVNLRATADMPPAQPAAGEPFVRTVVRDVEPALSFACDLPAGWQRVPLPSDEVDFADPHLMRPMAIFTPNYATLIFAVATRPAAPGVTPAEALAKLAAAQGLQIGEVHTVTLPCGPAAQTLATQRLGNDEMKMRLVLLEDGGHLFSLSAMAPPQLWDALRPTLDRIVESFVLLDPRGPAASKTYDP